MSEWLPVPRLSLAPPRLSSVAYSSYLSSLASRPRRTSTPSQHTSILSARGLSSEEKEAWLPRPGYPLELLSLDTRTLVDDFSLPFYCEHTSNGALSLSSSALRPIYFPPARIASRARYRLGLVHRYLAILLSYYPSHGHIISFPVPAPAFTVSRPLLYIYATSSYYSTWIYFGKMKDDTSPDTPSPPPTHTHTLVIDPPDADIPIPICPSSFLLLPRCILCTRLASCIRARVPAPAPSHPSLSVHWRFR